MITPNSNYCAPSRTHQLASSSFRSALAQSLAKFQREIQAHHDASLEHCHDLWQLRTNGTSPEDAVPVDGRSLSKEFDLYVCSPQGRSNGTPNFGFPASSEVDSEAGLQSMKAKDQGHHPCQLISPPALPPPAPLPPAVQATLPLDDEDPMTSEAARAIKAWEYFVHVYAMSDIEDLIGIRDDTWDFWEIQPCWLRKRSRGKFSKVRTQANRTGSMESMESELDRTTRAGDRILSTGLLQRIIIEPNSMKRVTWVILGALIILYDLVMIPMGTIVEPGFLLNTIAFATLVYWMLDLPLNFVVGFLENGIVEMRPAKVALRYLKTWFAFDVVLVIFDVFFFTNDLLDDNTGAAGAVRSAKTARMGRLLRLIRGIRLLRLVKLGQMFAFVIDIIQTEYRVLSLKLLAHLCLILGINHYVACGWFGLGREIQVGTFGHGMQSWIVETGIENSETYVQYLMSLHWSVTQFTPATNDINPTCAVERAYAIMIVLFALVTFSSFVSSVTNTVNEMRRINVERTNEMARLRQFISKRQVSQTLAMRIWHFFRQNYQKQRRTVLERDIKFFLQVPQSLMANLHEEMYMPVFRSHGALNRLRMVDLIMTSRICHTCFSDWYDIPKQDIFLRYSDCSRVLFVAQGRLLYRRPPDNAGLALACIPPSSPLRSSIDTTQSSLPVRYSMESDVRNSESLENSLRKQRKIETEVINVNYSRRKSVHSQRWKTRKSIQWNQKCDEGQWVSEPALWVTWKHWGQLSTESHVEMIVVECVKFHQIFGAHAGPLWHALKAVAIFFAEYAENELQNGRAVTDVNVGEDMMDAFAQRSLTFQTRRDILGEGKLLDPHMFRSSY